MDVQRFRQRDDLGEVAKAWVQAVDPMDNHHIDPLVADVVQQLSQCRASERGARKARVFKNSGACPPLRPLAYDIGLAGLTLGIDGVELHGLALIARGAAVKGTASGLCNLSVGPCRQSEMVSASQYPKSYRSDHCGR